MTAIRLKTQLMKHIRPSFSSLTNLRPHGIVVIGNKMPGVVAVILVGGKARRFNGTDKSELMLGSKTCLEWTIDVLADHVDEIALSVDRSDRYDHAKNYTVVFDWPSEKNEEGVALAILGSLAWAKKAGYNSVISTPVDTPLLPQDYVSLLTREFDGRRPSVFKTPEGLQGLHAIWPVSCFDKIQAAVLHEGIFKISSLHAALKSNEILVPDTRSYRFTNVNNETGLRIAKQYIS